MTQHKSPVSILATLSEVPGTELHQLKATFDVFGDFVKRYAPWLSPSEIFVETLEDLPVGAPVRLEILLREQTVLIRALGEVSSETRRVVVEGGPPGLVVRITYLDPASERLIESISKFGPGAARDASETREPEKPAPPAAAPRSPVSVKGPKTPEEVSSAIAGAETWEYDVESLIDTAFPGDPDAPPPAAGAAAEAEELEQTAAIEAAAEEVAATVGAEEPVELEAEEPPVELEAEEPEIELEAEEPEIELEAEEPEIELEAEAPAAAEPGEEKEDTQPVMEVDVAAAREQAAEMLPAVDDEPIREEREEEEPVVPPAAAAAATGRDRPLVREPASLRELPLAPPTTTSGAGLGYGKSVAMAQSKSSDRRPLLLVALVVLLAAGAFAGWRLFLGDAEPRVADAGGAPPAVATLPAEPETPATSAPAAPGAPDPGAAPETPSAAPGEPSAAAPSATAPPASAPSAAAPPASEPVTPVPSAAAPPASEPVTPVPSATAPSATAGDPASEVQRVVEGWARAWSEQRPDAYVAAYASDFSPPNKSRDVWREERRTRILAPERIRVELSDLEVEIVDDRRALARFFQSYETDRVRLGTRKTLELERRAEGWKIVEERLDR